MAQLQNLQGGRPPRGRQGAPGDRDGERVSPPVNQDSQTGQAPYGQKQEPLGGGALRQLPVERVADGRWEETTATKNRTEMGPWSSLGLPPPPP